MCTGLVRPEFLVVGDDGVIDKLPYTLFDQFMLLQLMLLQLMLLQLMLLCGAILYLLMSV